MPRPRGERGGDPCPRFVRDRPRQPGERLDLALFIEGEPSEHYRTWFEAREGLAPLHVSARCDLNLDVWMSGSEEPAGWALGLPVELPHVWLWCGGTRLAEVLGDHPVLSKPGSPPEIEDMVDAALKVRRHARDGDELTARLEAQAAARLTRGTLRLARERNPSVDKQPEIEHYLLDGTLERLLD